MPYFLLYCHAYMYMHNDSVGGSSLFWDFTPSFIFVACARDACIFEIVVILKVDVLGYKYAIMQNI